MARLKATLPTKLVWRISAERPNGAWVDPSKLDDAAAPSADLPEVSSGSWVTSSYDLLQGTDVIEDEDGDTIPADLFDELFSPPKKAQAALKK